MNEFDFKTRSLGTRFYFGVGGEYAFGNQWKAFAQIGGEHGNRLNVDFSCKAGIKYTSKKKTRATSSARVVRKILFNSPAADQRIGDQIL